MSEPRYSIMFAGEVLPDFTPDTVKANLASLFKSDLDKIEALFSGQPVPLKRNLESAEADKYLAALQRAGAKVSKQSEGLQLSLVATDDHPDEDAEPDAASSNTRMTCPKCAHEQAKAIECEACGIVIEKYLARQAQLQEEAASIQSSITSTSPAAEPAVTASASPYAPPQANVAEQLPEFGELKPFGVTGRIGRLRYLAWSLVLILVMAPALGIAALGMGISDTVGIILIAGVTLAMVVVSVQIGVQRLHDIGWSGWLYLLNLVPIVGSVFPLLMLLIPGNAGANRYGPPQPPNSTAVKVLASLWLVILLLVVIAAFVGGVGMLDSLGGDMDLSSMDTESSYAEPAEAAAPAAAYEYSEE